VAVYKGLGAEGITAIATSAVRDASNGDAFVAELRERFALSARILDGATEAHLTYRGATSRWPPTVPTVVVDIGGGSTELVVGTGDQVVFHTSLQAGVVRHSERHINADPPVATELETLAGDVRAVLYQAASDHPEAHAEAGIAVAGTATSLAAIDLSLDPYDPDRVDGHALGMETIQKTLSELASVPLDQRATTTGLHPDRAPTIVAGIVILIEVMRAFGLDRIEVSERDILHGAALTAADAD